ncbi:hypothetical protein DNK47_03005 [Mycoplasma wenyonii]|uniref:Uncharacterized protein n=1 Tax=Mycoplasma wenyonii TaxID=65123 RepID=A0A328PJ29_9MOLU|nr:hypothetical protein [Mycoplasma wenyonii]RAO94812.1 hypothetical protein DNK47_03005 [Mycoplasma wenyonii]
MENKKGDKQRLLSDFQRARGVIEQWTKSETNVQSLSWEERESLLKFYEFLSAMNTQKNGFAQELSEFSPDTIDISENQASRKAPSVQTVMRSLRILQWNKNNTRMSHEIIRKNKWK